VAGYIPRWFTRPWTKPTRYGYESYGTTYSLHVHIHAKKAQIITINQ